jgi:PII-like signaling protein
MKKELRPASKLSISIGGDERFGRRSMYRAALEVLRELGISGATVTRGAMSFGHRRIIHSMMNEITMDNLPLIIEAVDDEQKVRRAAERIAEMLGDHGLVQIQPTMTVREADQERSER